MRTINLFRNVKLFRILFGLEALALALFTIMPDSTENGLSVPHLTESGFFLHLVAYLSLSALGYWAYRYSFTPILLVIIIYSMVLEGVQHYIPYRSFNYWDIVANLAGIFLFTVILYVDRKRRLKLN